VTDDRDEVTAGDDGEEAADDQGGRRVDGTTEPPGAPADEAASGSPYRSPTPPPPGPEVVLATVAWERRDLAWPLRYLMTLAEALTPRASTPLLRGRRLRPPVGFALLTALPAALTAGIIPFTHHLLFGPTFRVTAQGSVSSEGIALDLARAAGLGLLVHGVLLLALALPYVSLSRAFARQEDAGARALRTLLYRSWLLPMGGSGLVSQLLIWAAPVTEAGPGLQLALAFAAVIPIVLLMVALRAAAVQLNGVPPLASWAVILVPVTLFFLTEAIVLEALDPVLPDPVPLDELERPGSGPDRVAPRGTRA